MASSANYRGFEIEVCAGTDGKYGYQIRGNGMARPIETNERIEDAETALALAKDFVDEHL